MHDIVVSIVIVSYNTKDILVRCLENLRDLGISVAYEIIIIDNASSDGSAEAVENCFLNTVVIKNDSNLLYAKACNQGAEKASGKYLFFLNSDAFPKKGHIEKLLYGIANSQENIACIGPRVLTTNGQLGSEGRPFLSIRLTLVNFLGIYKWPIPITLKEKVLPRGYHRFEYGSERIVDWVSGSCMLMTRSAWNDVGPFDVRLYFYREDLEWCYRARKKGWYTKVIPSAEVVHIGGASSRRSITYHQKLDLLKGEKYFYKTTQGFVYHLVNSSLVLSLYPLPYFVCKLTGHSFYAKAARRQMSNSFNTIKIILHQGL